MSLGDGVMVYAGMALWDLHRIVALGWRWVWVLVGRLRDVEYDGALGLRRLHLNRRGSADMAIGLV